MRREREGADFSLHSILYFVLQNECVLLPSIDPLYNFSLPGPLSLISQGATGATILLLRTRWGVTAYRHSSHFYLIPSESLNPCVQPGMPSYKAHRLMALTGPGFSTQHAPDILPSSPLHSSFKVSKSESGSPQSLALAHHTQRVCGSSRKLSPSRSVCQSPLLPSPESPELPQ